MTELDVEVDVQILQLSKVEINNGYVIISLPAKVASLSPIIIVFCHTFAGAIHTKRTVRFERPSHFIFPTTLITLPNTP